VAKWTTGGAISLGHLVAVLLELRSDFADLPLPGRRELALEGYLAAMSHVRARIDPAAGCEPLDREHFWCLFPDPLPARPIRDRTTAPGIAGRRLPSLLLGASAAALVVLAVAAAWRSQDGRLRRLEATLARREAGWADRFDRLEATLARREAPPPGEPPGSKAANSRELQPPTPADGSTKLALARIEARLGELGRQLEEGQAGRDQDDQRGAQIRRDLDRLRQEVEMAVRASR
jgi:hypothetical protein